MAVRGRNTEIRTISGNAKDMREEKLQILALYVVALAITLLLNWYVQPSTLFWG